MTFLLILTIWIICGLLAYGRTFAHFQRAWPSFAREDRESDALFAMGFALAGPIGLIAALCRFRHGFMWRTPK